MDESGHTIIHLIDFLALVYMQELSTCFNASKGFFLFLLNQSGDLLEVTLKL